MMQEPVLTLSILTPKSYAERANLKRSRLQQSKKSPTSPRLGRGHGAKELPGLEIETLKNKAEEALKRRAVGRPVLLRKSPTNGHLLDPFETFPIQTTSCVARMAQFFIQVWAPQHGVPFALEGHSNPYLSLLWPFALQHDMCFEAIIALCRAAWLTDQGRSSRHDGAYVFHRRNVMDTLRKRLLVSHQCADDATILTIAALGTIDYVLGDHTSAVSNVQVMREVVKVRGGLKSSSPWEQLIKHNVLAYEALWSFLVDPATLATVNTHSGPMVEKAELPIYMTHPFKPEVCEMLSKLPQGFCDVGLNGIFSLQMIRLLHDLGAQRAHLSAGKARGETETNSLCKLRTMLTDFHRLATLHTTPTEHFLCYGLIAYCYLLRFIYFQERPNALDEKAIGALFGSATATNTGEELGTEAVDRRCFLWTVMLIGAVLQHTEKIPSGWHSVMDQLLDRYHEARDWDMLEQELRLCFWDDPVRDMCRFSHQEAGRRKQRQSECDREQRRSTMAIRNVIL